MSDTTGRSLVKAISWRITASLATFIISMIVAGDFSVAGTIAGIQLVVNFLLYFMHERIWNRIRWGQTLG